MFLGVKYIFTMFSELRYIKWLLFFEWNCVVKWVIFVASFVGFETLRLYQKIWN